MILRLKKIDIAVLLLHTGLMRKGARNVFKRNYSKTEGKDLLNSYDEVKNSLETKMQEVEEQDENILHDIHYNRLEIDMLHSFLMSYIPQLEKTLKQAGNVQIEDKKQIDTLKMILNQLEKLLEQVV